MRGLRRNESRVHRPREDGQLFALWIRTTVETKRTKEMPGVAPSCFFLHSASLDYCVFMCHLPPTGTCWALNPQRATHSLATRPLGARPPCAALCTCERDRVLHCVYLAWARMKRCVTDACPPDASRSRALPCLLLQSASVVTLGVARRVNQRAPLHVLRSSTTPAR